MQILVVKDLLKEGGIVGLYSSHCLTKLNPTLKWCRG
uniref:Uncharacterized protein n=1 Tax=Arundo donax TaxID=35708 RepID=A0A0A8ZJB9_ARUDO